MTTLDETLKDRGERYGEFTDNAVIAQRIKHAMRFNPALWQNLKPAHQEALDVIASKMARIISGDPNYPDNWHDIQGYAKLAEDRIKK